MTATDYRANSADRRLSKLKSFTLQILTQVRIIKSPPYRITIVINVFLIHNLFTLQSLLSILLSVYFSVFHVYKCLVLKPVDVVLNLSSALHILLETATLALMKFFKIRF